MRILLAIVAVAGVGGLLYWLLASNEEPASNMDNNSMESTVDTKSETEDSDITIDTDSNETVSIKNEDDLKRFMDTHGSVQCEFKTTMDGSVSVGTIWVSADKNMTRVIGESAVNGVTHTSHMLSDGEYTYTWGGSQGGSTGFKMAVPEDSEEAETGMVLPDYEDVPDDIAIDMQYNCTPAKVSADKFVLPSDIEFRSMDDMFPTM